MTEIDFIPVRALNQATYCPRLYYLQHVDCVRPINEHVEGGLFDHRRVDQENLKHRTRQEGAVERTRGVALSSERLRISGVLDVVEQAGDQQYPVETKHGRPFRPDDGPPTVWENDAVQLCAQALLLEEQSGQTITHGVQYYVSTQERIQVELTPELRTKTLEMIQVCQTLSTQQTPPSPLPTELRHRCFGCSLAPVCLPEETLYEINRPQTPEPIATSSSVVRVIPHMDDGAVVYVQEPGSHVGKRSEHLVVTREGKVTAKVPLHAVRQLVIFGNVQVSTQALQTMLENEVSVSYLTGHGKYIGSFTPPPHKNVGLREAQYQAFANDERCRILTRAILRAKLTNQRTYLMRNLRTEEERGKDEPAARGIAQLLTRLESAHSIDTLLGLEGQAAALYFGEFGRFLKPTPGQPFDFTTRNRRPPRDPVNALLSFAYAILAKDCFAAINTVGFDPYKGFFHKNRHGKPSLALDLMEEFRPIIADSVVLTLINNELVEAGDFLTWRESCHMTDSARRAFFRCYEQRKSTLVTHPVYGYRMTYGRMIEVQARMLAAFVRGDIPQYTGFAVR